MAPSPCWTNSNRVGGCFDILEITKDRQGQFHRMRTEPVRFVPLTGGE